MEHTHNAILAGEGIRESMDYTRWVNLEMAGSVAEVIASVRAAWPKGGMDWVEVDDYLDIWGWTAETPEDGPEWRLAVTLAEHSLKQGEN